MNEMDGDVYGLDMLFMVENMVHKNEKDAVGALLSFLISIRAIDMETYGESDEEASELISKLKNETHTEEDLHKVCEKYGNSYFEQEWCYKIEKKIIG